MNQPAVTTYTASITNGVKSVKVLFDETSDETGLLLASAMFATTEDDLSQFRETEALWVEEIRNALTDGLVYFLSNQDIPEYLHLAPVSGDSCVMA